MEKSIILLLLRYIDAKFDALEGDVESMKYAEHIKSEIEDRI